MLKLDREVIISDILYIVEKALEQANDNSRFRLNRLKKERDTAEKKKKGVFDAFFAGNIYEEDMKLMNEEYRQQICKLNNEIDAEKLNLVFFDKERFRASIREKIEKIIYGIDVPDILYGEILDHITAYPDRRLEVRLKYLPSKWIFSL